MIRYAGAKVKRIVCTKPLGFKYVIVAKCHKSAQCAAVFAHYVEIDMRVKHTIASGSAALYNERARS